MKKLIYLIIIFFNSVYYSQSDTLIYYDCLTGIEEIISTSSFDSTGQFDFTNWNYGSESGFINLDLNIPTNTFPNSGFTDYKSSDLFFTIYNYPVRTAVKIFVIDNDTLYQKCSGVMIASNLVLTSEHCLCDDYNSINRNYNLYDSLLIAPAYNNGNINETFGSSIGIGYYFPKSAYKQLFVNEDIAIIKIKEPLGAKTGWVGIAYSKDENFYKNNIFHKFSYPMKSIDTLHTYNGNNLFYNYGKLDVINNNSIGYNILGIPGQSGSSLLFTDNTKYFSIGTLKTSFQSNHYRIQNNVFYAFKNIIESNLASINNQFSIIPDFSLSNSYPNPFNSSATISYLIPENTFVELTIYDMLGNVIEKLVNEYQNPGNYQVVFNADNLASGIYFYRIQTRDFSQTKKMILLK